MRYTFIEEQNEITLQEFNDFLHIQRLNPSTQKPFESEEDALQWSIEFIRQKNDSEVFNIDIEIHNEDNELVEDKEVIVDSLITFKFKETSEKLLGKYTIKMINIDTEELTDVVLNFTDGVATKRLVPSVIGKYKFMLDSTFVIGETKFNTLHEQEKYSFYVK